MTLAGYRKSGKLHQPPVTGLEFEGGKTLPDDLVARNLGLAKAKHGEAEESNTLAEGKRTGHLWADRNKAAE